MRVLIAGLLAIVACKGGDRSSPTSDASTPSPTPAPAPRPTITIADIQPLLPAIAGDPMLALQATPDGHQLHATWCVGGTGADRVAIILEDAMKGVGWTATSRRGDGVKAAVSGDRDRYRLSFVVTASTTPTCAAPAHYFVSATAFRTR